MRMSVVTRGVDRWHRSMETLAAELNRSLPSLTAQGARSCAINYGYNSQPFGFDESTAAQYREVVKGQVAQVYATRENASAVYLLIKAVDPVKAEEFWSAHKKGRKRRMLDIINSVSIQKSTDIAILKKARTGRHGNVPKNVAARSLVTKQQLTAIQKQQEKLVGFAKAGWYQAARALGRVRRSVETDGRRTSEEIFPGYIRTLARRFPGIGYATTISSGNTASTTISSMVRHAANAMPRSRQKQAEASAQDHFNQACREAMQRLIAKRRSTGRSSRRAA